MNTPLLSKGKRMVLLGSLFGLFVITSLPDNNFELLIIVSLLIGVSYDAWWSGVESKRK